MSEERPLYHPAGADWREPFPRDPQCPRFEYSPQRMEALCEAAKVQYFVFPGTTVTVCCMTLPNGCSVVGASQSPMPEQTHENFDRALGERLALREARFRLAEAVVYLAYESAPRAGFDPNGEG